MFELLLVSALDFYIGSAGLRAAAGILFAGTPFHPFVEGLLLSLESTPLVRQKVTPLAGATWVARDLLRELWVWALHAQILRPLRKNHDSYFLFFSRQLVEKKTSSLRLRVLLLPPVP